MQNIRLSSLHLVFFGLAVSIPNGAAQERLAEATTKVVLASEIDWQQLNPKRGDKSPQAGTLWGDRNGSAATGFLVKFVDGFSSPPHIHNVSYRGVVIAGGVHNDDPDAKPMWMPAGSFWTQPAGEVHITASRGIGIAYIEIDKGPYLVLPEKDAWDNGERPFNIDPSNLVWLDTSSTSWIESPVKKDSANGPDIAFLWGNPKDNKPNGTLVRLPAGFHGEIQSNRQSFQAVLIGGSTQLQLPKQNESKTLTPGSYFSSKGISTHRLSCHSESGCIIYVRSNGSFKIVMQDLN